jgi:GNAT superfamily N-acetyltransferase
VLRTLDDRYLLDDDPARVDLDRVHRWMSEEAYWALGRTREQVETSLTHSIVLGAYLLKDASSPEAGRDGGTDGEQVAVARAVTDRVTFAWLADVFVDPAHRGRGLGRAMVATMVDLLKPFDLRRVLLATHDAHGVYAGVGFHPPLQPERFMELRLRP